MAEKLTQPDKSLQKLIDFCSSNENPGGFSYNELRESLVKSFRLKADTDPETAADLALDRVAFKVTQSVKIEDLTKYSIGVARFIFLERLKQNKHERLAADEFYSNRIVEETDTEETDVQLRKWRECFETLANDERELLRKYFAELSFSELNERRSQICSDRKISLNNLRLKIFRLRQRLEKCVKNKLR